MSADYEIEYSGTFEQFLLSGALAKVRWQFDRNLAPPDENGCIFWKGSRMIGEADRYASRWITMHQYQISAKRLAWWFEYQDDILDAETLVPGRSQFYPSECDGYCLNPAHMRRIRYDEYGQRID